MSFGSNEFWIETWKAKAKAQSTRPEIVKMSPDGRYIQYDEILGRGAFKIVYKGFDEIDGIEVAWSTVRLEDVLQSPEHLERLYSEVHLLRSLKHENVIRSYASWVDDENKSINMITELFTSGSLRQYRRRHKYVDIKAIKNWAVQILRGLEYLHTQSPRIIHRDLKCDNIFVNGNHGEVKIGDLGLATIMQQPTARSVIGTPEFMAPELYEEEYNELVDIYSFGMCILELVTCEYPYSECKNQAQIYKKVSSGIKPAALGKIQDPELKRFIEKCLVPASERSSATELLKDPFLMSEFPKSHNRVHPQFSEFTSNSVKSQHSFVDQDHSYKMLSDSSYTESMVENCPSFLEFHKCSERYDFGLKVEKYDDQSISFTLRIANHTGHVQNIHFQFYFQNDTALSIAEEMVEHLDLFRDDIALIADMIDSVISQFMRWWGTLSGSLNGAKKSYDGSAAYQNENSLTSNQSNFNLNGFHGQEHIMEGASSDLTGSKNNGISESGGPSLFNIDTSSSEKNGSNFANSAMLTIGPALKNGCLNNSEVDSYAGSWTTASSEMKLSFSSLSLTDKDSESSDELKVELEAIDTQYRRCCHELLEMRETAIQNAKKKWAMKISVL